MFPRPRCFGLLKGAGISFPLLPLWFPAGVFGFRALLLPNVPLLQLPDSWECDEERGCQGGGLRDGAGAESESRSVMRGRGELDYAGAFGTSFWGRAFRTVSIGSSLGQVFPSWDLTPPPKKTHKKLEEFNFRRATRSNTMWGGEACEPRACHRIIPRWPLCHILCPICQPLVLTSSRPTGLLVAASCFPIGGGVLFGAAPSAPPGRPCHFAFQGVDSDTGCSSTTRLLSSCLQSDAFRKERRIINGIK